MSVPAKAARLGPRIVLVPIEACDGCPALALKEYRGTDGLPHTEASCRHQFAPAHGMITSHWRRGRPAPAWCPGADRG